MNGFVDTSRNNLNSAVGSADSGALDANNDTLPPLITGSPVDSLRPTPPPV